jgi:hypothetical protein
LGSIPEFGIELKREILDTEGRHDPYAVVKTLLIEIRSLARTMGPLDSQLESRVQRGASAMAELRAGFFSRLSFDSKISVASTISENIVSTPCKGRNR